LLEEAWAAEDKERGPETFVCRHEHLLSITAEPPCVASAQLDIHFAMSMHRPVPHQPQAAPIRSGGRLLRRRSRSRPGARQHTVFCQTRSRDRRTGGHHRWLGRSPSVPNRVLRQFAGSISRCATVGLGSGPTRIILAGESQLGAAERSHLDNSEGSLEVGSDVRGLVNLSRQALPPQAPR